VRSQRRDYQRRHSQRRILFVPQTHYNRRQHSEVEFAAKLGRILCSVLNIVNSAISVHLIYTLKCLSCIFCWVIHSILCVSMFAVGPGLVALLGLAWDGLLTGRERVV
jgi:hypothetical protein